MLEFIRRTSDDAFNASRAIKYNDDVHQITPLHEFMTNIRICLSTHRITSDLFAQQAIIMSSLCERIRPDLSGIDPTRRAYYSDLNAFEYWRNVHYLAQNHEFYNDFLKHFKDAQCKLFDAQAKIEEYKLNLVPVLANVLLDNLQTMDLVKLISTFSPTITRK